MAATLVTASVQLMSAGCARSRSEEGPAATRAAEPPALDAHTRGWEPRQWYAYALKLTSAVSFGEGGSAFDFDLEGIVQIAPTQVTSEAATLYVGIANPRIVSRVSGSQPEFDKVARQIASTGCFFTVSGGRVTEMYAPRGLPSIAANTFREIGAALQFARTIQPNSRYTAEEYDTTGKYVAEYQLVGASGVWSKRRLRYGAILAAKTAPQNVPAQVVPRIDDSRGEIRLLPDGRPQAIELLNVVTVSGAQVPVHSKTSLSLQAGPAELAQKSAPTWNSLLAGMVRTAADEPYAEQTTIESLDHARIGDMTFEQAVARFEQLGNAKKGSGAPGPNDRSMDSEEKAHLKKSTEEEATLFIALSAIFREQPSTIAQAVHKIRAKSPATDVLIGALSSASSPAAQQALVDLANAKSTDPAIRDQILMGLVRTPRPDPISIDALKTMLEKDPFSELALLGLGSYSRRLRDAGTIDSANDIGELLIDRLKTAENTSDRLTALRAMVNAGYAPALPHVIPYLTADRVEIRAAAVRSLQSMSDARVDGLLAVRLQSDSSREVRISALGAAKIRVPTDTLAHAVENAATAASDPHVRFRAVEVLAAWKARRPELRAALERIAESDQEARIRDRAKSALSDG